MKKTLILFLLLGLTQIVFSQSASISEDNQTAHESAILDISSSNKGVLFPRTFNTEISNPAEGLLIYDNLDACMSYYGAGRWTIWNPDGKWRPSNLNIYNLNNQYVGIGATLPESKLHLFSSNTSDGVRINGINPTLSFGENNTSVHYLTDTTQINPDIKEGSLVITTEKSVLFRDGHDGIPSVIIDDSSRNIGIGNPAPTARLSLKGGTAEQLRVGRANNLNSQFLVGFYDADSYATITAIEQGSEGKSLIFSPHGGNIGIGLTDPIASLHVKSTDEFEYGIKVKGGDFSIDAVSAFEIDGPNSPGGRFRVTAEGYISIGTIPVDSLIHRLQVNGNASKTSGTGEWVDHSDRRLKKNITPLNSEEMLSKLLQLQGIQYEWDDQQTGLKRPGGIQYGFTAQNIQEVFPEFVKEDAYGFLQTTYGTYDAMYVECFRALNEKIETLEQETGEIEKKFSTLDKLERILMEQEERLIALKQLLTKENQ